MVAPPISCRHDVNRRSPGSSDQKDDSFRMLVGSRSWREVRCVSTSAMDSRDVPRPRPRVSLEELLVAKGTKPIRGIEDLAADTFASDEEVEVEVFVAFNLRRAAPRPVLIAHAACGAGHRRRVVVAQRETAAGRWPLAARLIGRRPVITFVTFGELAKWVEIRQWGARSRQELADWMSGIPILPGDETVAATWGVLSAVASRRGRPRPVNDMWPPAGVVVCSSCHDTDRDVGPEHE